jgi:predicted AlkP superfamily pyrophosphatase or phosphodiesterase
MIRIVKGLAVLGGFLLALLLPCVAAHANPPKIDHVLLISIDGMHALDYLNCANGISTINWGKPYCPHLAALGATGVNYLSTSTSTPSDSFPGLMALMTGGSPRTMGVNYDVAYDRALSPPFADTGNGLLAGPCTPGSPSGTSTE